MLADTLIINPHPHPPHDRSVQRCGDFSEFLRWVSEHWHDREALREAQWIISPFVAMAQRNPGAANLWREQPWRVPPVDAAGRLPQVAPAALRWLDADGARALLSTTGPAAELQLAGLTELDAATAQALATFGGTLDLSGLTDLQPEVSTALAAHMGIIRLDSLAAIGGSVAPLVRRRAPRGSTQPGLSLGGLTRITAHDAQFLAQVQGDLYLNGLTHVDAQQAQYLAQRQGDGDKELGTLHLDCWQQPSAAALQALGAYRGPLSLGAWVPPPAGAPDLWTALASAPREGLALGAIQSLSEVNAQELAKLELDHLYLPSIQQLDATLIEHLGAKPLLTLALDGVVHATAAQVRRLAHLQNLTLSGLSMASLELTPEVRAELFKHANLQSPEL